MNVFFILKFTSIWFTLKRSSSYLFMCIFTSCYVHMINNVFVWLENSFIDLNIIRTLNMKYIYMYPSDSDSWFQYALSHLYTCYHENNNPSNDSNTPFNVPSSFNHQTLVFLPWSRLCNRLLWIIFISPFYCPLLLLIINFIHCPS